MQRITDILCKCNKCEWSGTVGDCEPDVDGDGSLGCPNCNVILRGTNYELATPPIENDMDTILKRGLHYVECYHLHWPDSGAGDVAKELRQEINAQQDRLLLEE